MYPGIATSNEFEPKEAVPIHFRENKEGGPAIDGSVPSANITESSSEYQLQLASPGLNRGDFKIEIKEGVIFIAAKRIPPATTCINDRCEFDYHNWSRAFILPEDADAILTQADYRNGELVIRIPKTEGADTMALVTVYVY